MIARQGKSVLVTGAGSGIGRAIAEAFLADGNTVHICDVNPRAIEDFLRSNPGATATEGDVSRIEVVDRAVAEMLGHVGGVDVLVNNTGVAGPIAGVEEIDPADWDHTLAVDLSSHYQNLGHGTWPVRYPGERDLPGQRRW